MSKIRSIVIILGAILLVIPSARAQATPAKIKLLARNTGWALIGGRLYWTTDFGHDWRDITPPQGPPVTEISDVFFLDTSRGWVLRRISHSTEDSVIFGSWGFDLAYTDNAGASWTVTPIQLPGFPSWEEFSGVGALDFLDTGHGWVNLGLVGGSGVAPGALFSTDDGGGTWRWMPKAPMVVGRVRFVTPADGWLAGGPSSAELFATSDGGEAWRSVTLNRPHGAIKHPFSSYDLPIFSDATHGTVVVADPWGREVSLFATDDGGRTWRLVADLPNLPSRGGYGVAATDSELLYARKSRGGGIRLTSVRPGRQARTLVSPIAGEGGIMFQISFSGARAGWALLGARLYATNSGGSAWSDITPPQLGSARAGVQAGQSTTSQGSAVPGGSGSPSTMNGSLNIAASAAAGGGGGTVGSLHTSVHLGFDSSTIPTLSDMAAWWANSPYYDFGVYIGGANGKYTLSKEYGPGTSNPTVTPSQWVSGVVLQGWGLLPFWVGLQSPCYIPPPNGETYSVFPENQPTTAFNDGANEASTAVGVASALGLGTGSIIYYDMENYDQTDSACQAAVVSFLDGWVYGLQNAKYVPGLYTNTGPAEADWPSLESAIQDIIVAKGDSRATIWGLDCNASGCGANVGLANATWGEGYRGHQYVVTSESYGGTNPYGLDRDIEWAQVDGGNLAKTYAYGTGASVQPGNIVFALNDDGQGNGGPLQAVGECDNGAIGFLWNSPSSFCFTPAGYSVGASPAMGINDQGNAQQGPEVVGYYETTNGPEGFIGTVSSIENNVKPATVGYRGEPFVELIGINDDDQILGVYFTGVGCPPQGFVYDTESNTYKIIDLGGDYDSYVSGINGFGQVTGGGLIGGKFVDFVWDWSQGTFTYTYSPNRECGSGSSSYQGSLGGINNNELFSLYCRDMSTGTNWSTLYDFLHVATVAQAPTSGGINDSGDITDGSGGIFIPIQ
jgi:hypothetical protein